MHGQVVSERVVQGALGAVLLGAAALAGAQSPTLEIYAAGSLRGVVTDTAEAVRAAYHIEIKPTFGSSGTLRERIEKGESPDLFLSADLASPAKLEAQGRTVGPAVVFARNRMCIVSRRAAGLSSANLIDRLLARGVRVKTSTPVADPSGDYAWAIFDRIEAQRPGAAAALKQKAQASMGVSAPAGSTAQHPYAALFAARQIEVAITYCSGVPAMQKDVPELDAFAVPARLDPHPQDGMAVLSGRPEALRVALFLFSEKGQAIIARQGLVPLAQPPGAAQ
jgi:molybdate transport system substrate-binding protein